MAEKKFTHTVSFDLNSEEQRKAYDEFVKKVTSGPFLFLPDDLVKIDVNDIEVMGIDPGIQITARPHEPS